MANRMTQLHKKSGWLEDTVYRCIIIL